MTSINQVFITVFLLSVAGTVVGITFLAVQDFLYRYSSARFLVKVNKIVILAFVIPVFYILGMLDRTNYYLSEYSILVVVEQGTVMSKVYDFRDATGFADILSMLWLVGLGLLLVFYAASHFIFRHRIRKSSREIEGGSWQEQFRTLCLCNEIPEGQVRLVTSTWENQICTVGMRNKTIIIPEYLLDKLDVSEIGIILRHEITHIRKNDVPMKLGMFILCCLNWFNPLVYYLNGNLNEWVELSCDEEMLLLADSRCRHAYVDALMKIMEEEQAQEELKCHRYAVYFSNGRNIKCIKRRLKGIMKKRTVKKTAQVFALFGVVCTMACGTTLAMDLEFPVNALLSDHVEVFDKTEYFEDDAFDEADGYDFISFDGEAMKAASFLIPDGEYTLVYEDGTMEPFVGNAGMEPTHEHTYVDTNAKKHEKKSDGSCTLTTYAAKKCTECGAIVMGEELSIGTFTPCRH